MNKFAYHIVFIVVRLFALLPFFVLYFLSDILYVILYKIVKYRQLVVRQNIKNSFPTYTDKQVNAIEKAFYHHFCDVLLETIKFSFLSDKEMKRRVSVKNPELVASIFASGNSCIYQLGHYCNWEAIIALPLHFPPPVKVLFLYKQLRSSLFDKLMLSLRQMFNGECVEKNFALRKMLRYKKQGVQTFSGFVADQTPSAANIRYWTEFMHQDTPVLDGAERIARSSSFALVYLEMSKVKRGYYEFEFTLMSHDVSKTTEFEMTELYVRLLEKTIRKNPAYYLWTHRRWKHKRTAPTTSAPL